MTEPFVAALLLAAEEGEKGGLMSVDTSLFVATLVLFAIFAFVLAKYGWGPLLRIIEEREKGIREGVEGAEKTKCSAWSFLKYIECCRKATANRAEKSRSSGTTMRKFGLLRALQA